MMMKKNNGVSRISLDQSPVNTTAIKIIRNLIAAKLFWMLLKIRNLPYPILKKGFNLTLRTRMGKTFNRHTLVKNILNILFHSFYLYIAGTSDLQAMAS